MPKKLDPLEEHKVQLADELMEAETPREISLIDKKLAVLKKHS